MPLISVDDHVQEPPDLWTRRLPKNRWAEVIPYIERPEVPPAVCAPSERLRAMDAAGVDYSVLYPTLAGLAGETFGRLEDGELELACVQAYNDWLIEEWGATSRRFIPQCIVPLWPPEATVAEIRRAVRLGHRGVVFPAVPHDLRSVPHVADTEWDVVWSVCEELGVPLCLHAGASPGLQNPLPPGLSPARAEALEAVQKPVSSVFVLNMLLFSRILIRHPKLRVVLAESALSWAMLDLEWAEHQFEHDGLAGEGYDLTPLQMFRRQVYLNAWFDEVAPFAPYLGSGNILWSANLPLSTSTWPRTQETIDRCLKGLSAEDRMAVLWDNAAALYGISR